MSEKYKIAVISTTITPCPPEGYGGEVENMGKYFCPYCGKQFVTHHARNAHIAWHKHPDLDKKINKKRKKGESHPQAKKVKLTPSPDLSYLLGALLGDGCVGSYRYEYNGKHKVFYLIAFKTVDSEFADKIEECLREIGLNPYKRITKRGYFEVRAYGYSFVKWYNALTLDKIEKLVESYKEHFIRGFYDAEGSLIISKKSNGYPDYRIVISNSNKELLLLIQRLLNQLGIQSRLQKKRTHWNIDIHSKKRVLKFLEVVGSSIRRKRRCLSEGKV